MADNLSVNNLATANIADVTNSTANSTDINNQTTQNLNNSVGAQFQQTLFWDYDNNKPPTTLPKRDYSPSYPNLLGGPITSLNQNKPKTWDDLSKESLNAVRQKQGMAGRSLILNPGDKVERYDVNRHNAIGYVRGANNEAIHAERQGWGGEVFAGINNTFAKAGAVAVSSLGFLGKLPMAILNGDISSATDNWLSNWADQVRSNPHNNVYHPADYDNKTAFEKLSTLTYYAETGADAAGFVIGSLLPTAGVSQLGLFAKGSKLIGNALYAAKAAQLAGDVAGVSALGSELSGVAKLGYTIANNQKWLKAMSIVETGLTQSFTEAAFEGADAKKRIYQDLISKGYSPDSAFNIASKNANAVIGLNTAILFPSSLFEINALLKGGSSLKAAAKFIREGNRLTVPTVGRYALEGLKGASKGIVVEGLWEENVQGSIQSLADKMSKGEINPGIGSIFSSLVSDTINNFNTPEGQENILGGAVMGVLMGGKEGVVETRENYKEAKNLLNKYQSSYTSHEQLAKDIVNLSNYFKDKSNYVIMNNGVEALDENNNIRVNNAKLISDIRSLGLTVDLTNTLTNAALNNDHNLENIAKSQLIGEYVYNHMSNGLEDRMFNKLTAYQNMSEDEKNSLGIITNEKDAQGNSIDFRSQVNSIKELAKQYRDIYNSVENYFPEVLSKDKQGNEYGYDTRSIFQESILNRSILNNLDNIQSTRDDITSKMIENIDNNIKHDPKYLNRELVGKFSSVNPNTELLNDEKKVQAYLDINDNSALSKQYNQINNKFSEYRDALTSSNKRYKALTDRNSIVKHLEKTIQSKEENEEKVNEEDDIAKEALENSRKADEVKSTKDSKENELSDLNNKLQDPNISNEERDQVREQKNTVQNEINELNKNISENNVVESEGTGQSLEDLIANANANNVDDIDPSFFGDEEGPNGEVNPTPRRASDSLVGATKHERALAAVNKIVADYNAVEQSENPIEKFGIDKMSEDEMLSLYDNLYGSKSEGTIVNFRGKELKIGDKYKNSNNEIWKVKGADQDNNLDLYKASDPSITTKVKTLDDLDNYTAISEEQKTKDDLKQDDTPKPLQPGQTINNNISNVFRIPNGNTFLEVYHNSYSMSKEQVSKLLSKMSPEDIAKNLYITFKREEIQSILKTKDQLFQPIDGRRNLRENPNLFQKKGTGFRFQIMLGDQILGYGTNPNKYVFVDENKKPISPNNLTDKQFAQIYELNQKNTITLDQFKKNYQDGVRLYTELYNRLGDQDSITLSINEVQELVNFKINPGEYDYSTDKQYKLSELEYNTIQGETYVMDMQNIYEPGTGRIIGRTVTPTISDPLKQDAVDKAIQQTFGSNINPDILRSYGRYVAVTQLPNGSIKFIELSTSVLSDEQQSKLLTNLQERQKESFNNINQEESTKQNKRVPISNLFNDDFNDKLNNSVFIAVKDYKGIDVSLGLTPTGILRVEVNDYSDPINPKGTIIYMNEDLDNIDSISKLKDLINDAIEKNNNSDTKSYTIPFKLENKSFKNALGKNASVEDYMDMQTSVNPGVVKNVSLELEVKDFKQSPYQKKASDINTNEVKPAITENLAQTPEQINTTATQLPYDLSMANIIASVNKHSDLTQEMEEFINDKLGINPESDIDSIQGYARKYINTFNKKNDKVEAKVEVGNNDAANLLQKIDDIKKSIEDVKLQGKNKTLTDQNGNVFTDNTLRAKYGKALLDNLNNQLKALQNQLPKDKTTALKVVNSQSTIENRTSLNEFKEFLKKNLPIYIDVQDINTLIDNLSNKGQTVGIFQTNLETVNGVSKVIGGTIGTSENNPFKYHEAFHSIFRLLLPEDKINQLLKEAKNEYKTNNLKEDIDRFRNSSSLYANLSNKEIEDRIYEEYMADKFDKWKTNKSVQTSSNIKNFFKKIVDWFKAFTTRIGLSKQDMMGLFEDINRGKYKNSQIQINRFTDVQESIQNGLIDDHGRPIDGLFPTNTALKLIKIGEQETTDEFGNIVLSPKYLTQAQSNKIVGTITAVFLNRYQNYKGSINSLVNNIMDDYANLYNSENESYTNRDDYFDILDSLDELRFAYTDTSSREALIENISYSLQQLGFKQSEEEDQIEDDTDELGDRQVGNYGIETSSIGGFGSLSKELRRYIASTTYPLIDEKGNPIPDQFGNTELIPGEPIIEAVDSNTVYNGLLKALANVNDQVVFVNRLVEYASGNEQSAHFIQRFISDTGLKINEDGTFSISKNPTLFQMVVKGFNQYRVDYLFTQKDAKNKVSKIFPSNQRDVAQVQFDLWYNTFTTLYQDKLDKLSDKEKQSFIADRKRVLDKIKGFLEYKKNLSEADLNKVSEQLSIELNAAYGISLSKNFMKYSILSGMEEGKRTKRQNKFFNAFSTVTSLTTEDINEISKTLQRQANPFVKGQVSVENMDEEGNDITSDIEVDDANIGRLKKIAENNAVLDETVGSSSFVSAAGKTMYGHQLPTFHLVATTDLTSKAYRNSLKKDLYLRSNYLLNSEKFNAIAENLRVARIDGLRQVTFSRDENGNYFENKSLDINKREGIVYGSYSDREFLLNLFDLYLYQKEGNYINEKGENVKFNTSPHLIRVLEASNTGDTIALPIERLFEKGKVNNNALNVLTNEVINEYQRIQRVRGEIKDIQNGQKKSGIIENYHNGNPAKGGQRGLRFFKFRNALDTIVETNEGRVNLLNMLETRAAKGINEDNKNYKISESEEALIKEALSKYFNNQVDNLIDLMVQQNILQGTKEKGLSNILLPTEIERGVYDKNGRYNASESERMELSDSIVDNIGQIFMNDFVNTLSYNQLLLNDAAKGLKDSVDEVKRAKGANGAGPSIEARILAPELGITHQFTESHIGVITEPKGTAILSPTKQEEVDRADAQMWLTVKGLRYTLFGLGKLNANNAALLDKISLGQDITKADIWGDNEVQGSLDYNGQTNSLKLVYYDGKKYIKTSGALLQKEFTSYWNGNQWVALPGRETLHNMRERMEDFEDRNNTVMFMVPKSASKTISEDIMKNDLSDFSDEKMKPLSNKFWRLQLENPSNKVVINDPTQAKQLIDMEQDDTTEVIFRGNKTTIGNLRDIYQRASEQRVKNNYFKARNLIFDIDEAFKELQTSIDQNKVTPKLAEFQKRAIETLQASGADSQLLGFFELDEQANPKYNLNMPLTLDKYTQLFLAYFSKGVTNEKVPGHAIALMSDFGAQVMRKVTEVDPNTLKPTKWEVIRSADFKQNPKKYTFKDLNTDTFKVGDYYTSDLQHNVPEYDQQGNVIGYYSEFMLPPHFEELMDIKPGEDIPDSVSKAFGVRIPSQDKHSFISLKMIDFMPANMGSTGIFAKELIKLSGADFDIDKLYMSTPSWYKNSKGDLVRYGDTANTNEDKYQEFLHYELNNNKDLKKLIKEKLNDSKDYNALDNDLKLYNQSVDGQDIIPGIDEDYESNIITMDDALTLKPDEINSFIKDKLKGIKQAAINEALLELGLPNDLSSFIKESKKGELNNGVLNNIILDSKIQFLTNNHIRPEIATEAAGVDLLANMTVDPDLKASVIQEANLDTDSILGKTSAFKNNKEGANGIGPAINAMLVYSLLNKYNIKLRNKSSEEEIFKLSIDNITYDGYDKTIATDGNRIMNNISTLVSAMTDNAKERLAAKLNISTSSVGVISNMMAQGVPLKTASAILLQPSIKEYFSASKRFSNKFKSAEDRMLNGEQINRADIGEKLLDVYKDLVEKAGLTFDPNYSLTTDELLATTRGELNSPMLQWKVLSDYMKMESQSRFYSSVSQIIKLSKGLGTTFEYGDAIRNNMDKLGLDLSDKDFEDSDIPFDARQVLTGKDKSKPYHNITANYISVFNQINELAKSLFIEKTDTFNRIKDIVFSNMDFSKDEFNREDEAIKMKKNLISYLSFKAYQKLMIDENKSSRLTSLSNKLLYDQLDTDNSYKDITERLEEARRIAPDNYLINRFLLKNSTTVRLKGEIKENKNNKDGINKVESNTWSKMSNSMAEKLQDSFRELYNDPNTKQYAIDLFNYLVVKDGLQFKSGSFLKIVPNFMFYDVLRGATKANDIMKLDTNSLKQSELDNKYKDTFNDTQTDLFNEFIDTYLSNINNAFHIPQITKLVKNNDTKSAINYTNNLQNELVIDIFADVRNEELKTYENADGSLTVESKKSTGKLDQSEKDKLSMNLSDIKESGFVIEDVTELDQNNKPKKKLKVNFPYIISTSSNSGKQYYKLIRVDNRTSTSNESKANNFISKGDTVAKGTKAVYSKIELKGSRAQTPIAQMFGELPNSSSVSKKVLQRSNTLEDTNPSIMEDQDVPQFTNALDATFGITNDGSEVSSVITQNKENSLPNTSNRDISDTNKLDTDSDANSVFYTAVDNNFDLSTLDSSLFMDDTDIQDSMDDMDVTDGNCG